MIRFIFCLFLIFGLVSCHFKFDQKKSALNLYLNGPIETLDPATSYDYNSGKIVYQIYEPLYEYHYLKVPYTLIPLLAADLPRYKNDGKTLIIPIKKGIYYQPNPCFPHPREVLAKDFITEIKRLSFAPLQSSGKWMVENQIEGISDFQKSVGSDLSLLLKLNISGLKTLDDHTLQIDLKGPMPEFIYYLAMSHFAPVPEEMVLCHQNDLSKNTIGTGPFILSYLSDDEIILKKNPLYKTSFYPEEGSRHAHQEELLTHAGSTLPLVETVFYRISKNPSEVYNLFIKNQIDMLEFTPIQNYYDIFDSFGFLKESLQKKNIKSQLASTMTIRWLSFNMGHPILGTNLFLRKAIAYALDRSLLIKEFTHNTGLLANSIYPPGILGYDPKSETPFNFDTNKAKNFLAKAGFPEGKNLPTFNLDLRSRSDESFFQANLIKKQLENIGIKINIIPNSFSEFQEKVQKGSTEIWIGGWSMDFPDPMNILQLLDEKNHPPGPNINFYSNSIINKKIDQLKLISDSKAKKIILDKIESIILDDLPWVPLYFERRFILYHPFLKNYKYSDFAFNDLKYLIKN